MIPHLLSGVMYTMTIRVATGAAAQGEPREVSTFDAFTDSYTWSEGDGFRFALVPSVRRGKHWDVTAYINFDDQPATEREFGDVRTAIAREVRSRGRGTHITHFGKPRLFLRLDSVAGRIAQEEETRSEKLFNELIDS